MVRYGTVPWPPVRGYGTLLLVLAFTQTCFFFNDLGKVFRRPRSLQMDQPKREDVRRKVQVVPTLLPYGTGTGTYLIVTILPVRSNLIVLP
jgi:hypothetical protein